ncbi:MAG: hypothetical protein JJU36_03030 [Phycisphaeraceae bacterium]|nr:hypothetical protein [Phycisphaeraceae bacterium]
MSEITPLGRPLTPPSVNGTERNRTNPGSHTPGASTPASPTPGGPGNREPVDRADLSEEGLNRSRGESQGTIRFDLVGRVRAEIAEGRYETPEKLDAAIDRLLADL